MKPAEKPQPKKEPLVDYRSAKTGQFVTEEYAEHHPATTVKEHNRLERVKR